MGNRGRPWCGGCVEHELVVLECWLCAAVAKGEIEGGFEEDIWIDG